MPLLLLLNRWSGSTFLRLGLRSTLQRKRGVADVSSQMSTLSCLVSCEWLYEQLKLPDFWSNYRIIDGTFDLAIMKRDLAKEHYERRVPGARRFDIDECADPNNSLPHMLPSAQDFASYVSKLGVENKHHVIVYDNVERFGMLSSPRVWWTFRIFGHDKVSVLDGGLPKWIKCGYKIASGDYGAEEQLPEVGQEFVAAFRPELLENLEFMLNNAQAKNPVQVMDARPSGRYAGSAPEPRADIPSGHMPQSLNIPFVNVLDPETKIMKSKIDIEHVFEEAGIDLDKEVISTCGSGVSAAVLAFAAYLIKSKEVAVYDGSWVEWATSEKVPKNLILKDI